MKRIIDSKRYDTETADLIHEWDNGIYGNDFKSCEETLYKTKNGSYFLHGAGGPMSKYAEPCGNNSMGGGSDIIPMDAEAAFQWLCDHGGEDPAETEFPELIKEA